MTATTPPFPGLAPATDPHWPGWYKWNGVDPFEDRTGPFFVRSGATGAECGFRAGPGHLNGHGFVHGGSLLTFADFALFMIAAGALGEEVFGVTATLNCEFVSAGREGDLLLADGELVRAGGTLLFTRGTIRRALPGAAREGVLAFSGTIRRLPRP